MSSIDELAIELAEVNEDIRLQADDPYEAATLDTKTEAETLEAETYLRMLLSYKVEVLEELLDLGREK